jgi:ribosomal-protein-alanine N-acetyltransferase
VSFRHETERLVLDLLRPGDEERAYGWTSDPAATRFMAWARHQNIESTREFVRRSSRPSTDENGMSNFAVAIRRKSDSLLLGTTGVHPHNARTVETGYILHPDSWGQGYGTEAVRGIVDWIFDHMASVQEVTAPIFAENVASQRLAQRVGMTCLREEQQDMPRGDKNVRIVIYGTSRDAWRARPSAG